MSSHIFTCLGIVFALSACAGRQGAARPAVDRALGCYVVRTDVDSNQRGWFPDTIALLSSRSKDGPVENTYRVRLTERQARRMSLLSFGWRNVGADSLEIVGSSGFFGVEFKGRFTADGFEGSAASFTDVIGPDPVPRYPVAATRARCLGF